MAEFENKGVSRVVPDTPGSEEKPKRGRLSGRKKSDPESGKSQTAQEDSVKSAPKGDSGSDTGKTGAKPEDAASGVATGSGDKGDGLGSSPSGNRDASVRGVGANKDGTGVSSGNPFESGGGSSGSLSGGNLVTGAAQAGVNGFRNFLDNMVGLGTKGVKALFSSVKGGFSGIGHKIGTGATYVVSGIARLLNIPQPVAVALIVILGGGGAVTGVITYNNNRYVNEMLRNDAIIESCAEEVEESKVEPAPTRDVNAMQLDYAKKIWGVCKALGYTDEMAAGVLGNMNGESSIDPTAVETVFTEPYSDMKSGDKGRAAKDLSAFTTSVVFPRYASSGVSINHAAYAAEGGNYCGIGLGQWTGPRAYNLIKYSEAAKSQVDPKYEWWDFELQCAFFIAPTANGGDSSSDWVTHQWPSSGTGLSVAEATRVYMMTWEGIDSRYSERLQFANQWYARFKGTMGDEGFANSVIAMANVSLIGGAGKKTKDLYDDCPEVEEEPLGNSDLARAAVAYAWETTDRGRGNDGTQLYQNVNNAVIGDHIYQSCDRGVATAVRWSDADDDFPPGITDRQDTYCATQATDQWECLGDFTGIDNLQPGDILITTAARRGQANGHIVIYVSNEIVREKYPNSNACFVSASLNTRSPGCEEWSAGKFVNEGYKVYRNIKTDEPGRYKSVGEGVNWSKTS